MSGQRHTNGQGNTYTQKKKNTLKRFILRLSESSESLSFRIRGVSCSQTVFNLKGTMDKKTKLSYRGLLLFFWRRGGGAFIIYLKIEQAYSSFYKGDQSNGFCQRPSFQVVLKPVNKLNTQRQSHAQVINKAHWSHAQKTNPQSYENQFICPCCLTCMGCCVHIYLLHYSLSPKYFPRLRAHLVTSFGGVIFGQVCHEMFLKHD